MATPADAALMMSLGCDGVFVGSGIFKSGDPKRRANAIVQATTHWQDPHGDRRSECRTWRSHGWVERGKYGGEGETGWPWLVDEIGRADDAPNSVRWMR